MHEPDCVTEVFAFLTADCVAAAYARYGQHSLEESWLGHTRTCVGLCGITTSTLVYMEYGDSASKFALLFKKIPRNVKNQLRGSLNDR